MATALSSRNIHYSFLVPKHNLRNTEVMVKCDLEARELKFQKQLFNN